MILFYIDESGTGWEDDQTKFFSLGSFAIHVNHWQEMDREIRTLKDSFLDSGKLAEWELKGRDIWQGVGKLKKVNREYRKRIFLQVAEALNKLNCYLFAVPVNKKFLNKREKSIKNNTELYQFTFDYLLERLDYFLKEQHETGMLFMDSRSTVRTAVQDTRLVKIYQDWVESRKIPSSFVELPWFGRSDIYTGLQLADYVTYLVHRLLEEDSKGVVDNALLQAFNLLRAKIDLSPVSDKSFVIDLFKNTNLGTAE